MQHCSVLRLWFISSCKGQHCRPKHEHLRYCTCLRAGQLGESHSLSRIDMHSLPPVSFSPNWAVFFSNKGVAFVQGKKTESRHHGTLAGPGLMTWHHGSRGVRLSASVSVGSLQALEGTCTACISMSCIRARMWKTKQGRWHTTKHRRYVTLLSQLALCLCIHAECFLMHLLMHSNVFHV